MKTKTLLSSVIFYLLTICVLTIPSFSQETVKKADQPVIEIKEIPVQQTIVIKADVPTKDISLKIGEMYSKLFSFAAENNTPVTGAPFAVYYSFDPQGNTVFEAGFPVASKINSSDTVIYKEFPAMKVVSVLYEGAYENMAPVYAQIQSYLETNKLKSTGSSWEVYLSNPQQLENPNDNQTMIYFPIE